jgi:hypothetical protein
MGDEEFCPAPMKNPQKTLGLPILLNTLSIYGKYADDFSRF